MLLYCAIPKRHKFTFTPRTFKLNVPWWNDLPNSIRAAESLAIFKNRLETHLFHLYLFYLFSHLADAFVQSDLQMRTIMRSLFDPLTLALSFLILFLNFFFFKKALVYLIFWYFICFLLFIIQLTKAKKASNTSLLYSLKKKNLLCILR